MFNDKQKSFKWSCTFRSIAILTQAAHGLLDQWIFQIHDLVHSVLRKVIIDGEKPLLPGVPRRNSKLGTLRQSTPALDNRRSAKSNPYYGLVALSHLNKNDSPLFGCGGTKLRKNGRVMAKTLENGRSGQLHRSTSPVLQKFDNSSSNSPEFHGGFLSHRGTPVIIHS